MKLDDKELVRYNFTRDYVKTSNGFRKRRIIKECVKGKYVSYDQAAAMMVAKDEEIQDLKEKLGVVSTERHADAEYIGHLQAELAQIKKENVENLADLISKKMIKSAEEISDTWHNNLIYGNNDDDDSNSGLSSAISGKDPS